MNRAEELRRAVKLAGLPLGAVVVYDALLSRADWATGTLPDDQQPRSLKQVAEWAGLPKSYVAEMLNVLEHYGWVGRDRPAEFRRGQSTAYRLAMGQTRLGEVREPLSGAERARRFRQRHRSGNPVTAAVRNERTGPIDRHERSGPYDRNVTDRSTVRNSVTEPQVRGGFMQWAIVGEVSRPAESQDQQARPGCIGGCGRAARRGCRTCWDHASLEVSP